MIRRVLIAAGCAFLSIPGHLTSCEARARWPEAPGAPGPRPPGDPVADTRLAVRTTLTARNPYKLYVSVGGSDAHDGTSPDRPLRTLAAASALARPGATVAIGPGVYQERLMTRYPGTAANPITFQGEAGKTVIDGSKVSWPRQSVNYGLVELNHDYTRLVGLKVVNSANSGIVLNANHLAVDACEVSGIRNHGITNRTNRKPDLGYSLIRDIAVRNNTVREAVTSRLGQGISLAADGFVVAGNDVAGVRDIGIDIWTGARHGEVYGNSVHDNPGDGPSDIGIYVDGASYVRIYGNRVYRNGKGIFVTSEDESYDTHHIWVYNNVVHDNRGAAMGIWDDTPRHAGAQDVLFAHNTLVNNQVSFYLRFHGNTAEIANNLGYSTGEPVRNWSTASTYSFHGNVWLSSLVGFVAPDKGDFRLTSRSPAIGKGSQLRAFEDDLGQVFRILTDFAGNQRASGTPVDPGAYGYTP